MLLNGLKIEDFKLIKIAFKYWELLQNKQVQYLVLMASKWPAHQDDGLASSKLEESSPSFLMSYHVST